MPPKNLVGIPWRVALALQADGWILRSDIIWSKPNPMPESVTDRPTKAHEYIFLLAKSERYYYDAEAIKEPSTQQSPGNVSHKYVDEYNQTGNEMHRTKAELDNWNAAGDGITLAEYVKSMMADHSLFDIVDDSKPFELVSVREGELTDDEMAFGVGVFCYCRQHVKPHLTGWCDVSPSDKMGLGVADQKEALQKCRDWGLKIYGEK